MKVSFYSQMKGLRELRRNRHFIPYTDSFIKSNFVSYKNLNTLYGLRPVSVFSSEAILLKGPVILQVR